MTSLNSARVAAVSPMKIEPVVQRERDQERRRILEEELQKEQSVLGSLLKQGPNADAAALARTHSNLAALRQELARASP